MLNPVIYFWIFLALAALLYKIKRRHAAKIVAGLALAILFIFSATPVPVWLLKKLEDRYPVFSPATKNNGMNILVLGAGNIDDPDMPELHKISDVALARMVEGIRLHYKLPKSKMVFSGGSKTGDVSQAEITAKAALLLGVLSSDTLTLRKPNTTWEEAAAYKERFGIGDDFILVTSASHMPRAMETFRRVGLKPIAAPACFFIKRDPDESVYNWKPSDAKLRYTEIAAHEYFGMWYYRWFKE